MQEAYKTQVRSLGWEDSLQEGMATHSSILAWRIPWTEETGRLQSIGSQRVRHDWSDLASTQSHNELQYLSFCFWSISFSMVSSRLIHVVVCIRVSFIFKAEWYSIACLDHICLSIHPLMGRHLVASVFGLLWIVLHECGCAGVSVFNFSKYIPRDGLWILW